MGADTKIEWCHHSWSPWHGCAKVSAGCANCYAEAGSKRNEAVLGKWGPNGTRVVSKSWDKPLAWDRAARKAGERRRVFPSLCDPFEAFGGPVLYGGRPLMRSDFQEILGPDEPWGLDDVRFELFALIRRTPNLDWLLLTKRPENIAGMMREYLDAWGVEQLPNLWLGVSCEDQAAADERIPVLLNTPAAVRFVSLEPLLGCVDLDGYEAGCCTTCKGGGETYGHYFSDNGCGPCDDCGGNGEDPDNPGLDWAIIGGESGPGARPFNVAWAERLVRYANCPVFVKQLGARPYHDPTLGTRYDDHTYMKFRDPKGGDIAEWPADLRVREFPAT